MNHVTRWTPTRNLLQQRFENLFDEMLGDARYDAPGESVERGKWAPAVDIRETKDALSLEVDLPGLSKEQVTVNVENNVLTISGERKLGDPGEGEVLRRVERPHGRFSRSFTLPNDVDRQKVGAKFTNGVLKIELPKAETTKPRSIAIQ